MKVSWKMPTLPSLPTLLLKRCQAGRCGSSGLRANLSRPSKERQYCTIAGPPRARKNSAPGTPSPGGWRGGVSGVGGEPLEVLEGAPVLHDRGPPAVEEELGAEEALLGVLVELL